MSMAVRDPHDSDPEYRYKAAMGNHGFAASPDGIHWTKLDVPAIPSSDEYNFSYNPKEGLFIHTVKRDGPYGRAVAIATSRDFKAWKDYGVVFYADAKDQEMGHQVIEARLANPNLRQTEYNTPEHYSIQIYNMGVFLYEGIFIGMPTVFHHTGKVPMDWLGFNKMHLSSYILGLVRKYGDYTGFHHVQLVCSRDLKNWMRLGNRKPFIDTSPLGGGAYDTQTMRGPSSPLERGNELWFYYTGVRQYAFITSGEDPGYEDYTPDAGAVCLAMLRRDGFISLDAAEKEGTLLTKSFKVNGKELFLNLNAGEGGLSVEVLSVDGTSLAASTDIHGNHTAVQTQWQEGKRARWQNSWNRKYTCALICVRHSFTLIGLVNKQLISSEQHLELHYFVESANITASNLKFTT